MGEVSKAVEEEKPEVSLVEVNDTAEKVEDIEVVEEPKEELKEQEPVADIIKEPVLEVDEVKVVEETTISQENASEEKVSNLVNVIKAFEKEEEIKKTEESVESIEEDKQSVGTSSDLGSLDSPMEDSDGDNPVESEEKND